MRKWTQGVALLLLVVSSTALRSASLPLIVSPADGDFARIQDAIDAAGTAGVIVVEPGTYRENLTIDRPVALLGREGVFLEPEDAERPVLAVDGTENVTIQGVRFRMANVAIDILRSSCTISGCSISASETGIRIVVFDHDAVSIVSTVFRSSGRGVGVLIVGSGTTLLAQCEFSRLATALSVGGSGTDVLLGCTLEGCYEAVVVSNTAHAVLTGNIIRNNYASGIRLDRAPIVSHEGTLCLIGNAVEGNDHWGLTLCGFEGTEHDASFGHVVGVGNTLSGNERGPVCPEDLLLPDRFFLQ